MNITPTNRMITDYHLTLSAEDAREAVDSPDTFADRLAEQLRAAGVVATPDGGGEAKPARRKPTRNQQITIGKGARKTRSPNGHGKGGASPERAVCPECGKEVKYLYQHRRNVHHVLAGTTNGAHPEAAPAAQ